MIALGEDNLPWCLFLGALDGLPGGGFLCSWRLLVFGCTKGRLLSLAAFLLFVCGYPGVSLQSGLLAMLGILAAIQSTFKEVTVTTA